MAGTSGPRLTPGAQRILDVASDLFYRRGIHAVGVDTIAAESGITKRTLYDRFASKDALVAAYLQQRHDRWWARLEDRLAAAAPPRALAVFDAYADGGAPTDRGCGFVNAAAELPRDHAAHAVVRAHKQAVRRRLAELLAEDGADAGLAEHLFLLLEGAIVGVGIDGDTTPLRTARDLAAGVLRAAPAP